MAAESQAQDTYVKLNGLRFHYREWGSASAPPLLIFHGITGHAWEFDRVAASLADQFHVMTVNQRGHGASDWADEYSPEVMAGDIAAIVSALGLGRVRILGHSMGGVNSWWFAARYPEQVERLVILDVGPETVSSEDLSGGIEAMLAAYAQGDFSEPEEAVAAYLDGDAGSHVDELRAFALNNIKQRSDGRWVWRFDARGLQGWVSAAFEEEPHWTMLRQIACPTLVILGSDSPFTTTAAGERMVREIPQSRLVVIPGAGHDVHIDQFDALMAELRPYLTAG